MKDRSLLDYWIILAQQRGIIYVVTITSIVAAVVMGKLVVPVYEARAVFYVPTQQPDVSYLSSDPAAAMAKQAGGPIGKEDDYKPYVGILKSTDLAQRVHTLFPQKSLQNLLRSDTDFEITDDLMVRIYARDHSPDLAAQVANAYLDGLNRILEEGNRAPVNQQPAYVQASMAKVQRDLSDAEAALKQYEEQHHIANLDTELASLTSQKTDIQGKLEDTLVSISANNGKQKTLIDEFRREGEGFAASEVATSSSVIDNMRQQLVDALTKLSEYEAEYGKNNLEVVIQKNKKKQLEQQLTVEIKRWTSSPVKPQNTHLETMRQQLIDLIIDTSKLEATAKGYMKSLARIDERLRNYPEIKARWNNLNDAVTRLRSFLQSLRTSLTEASMQSGRSMRMIVPLDRAEPPKSPAFPIAWLNMLVALFGGALAGIGYAFFLNYLAETGQVRTRRLVRTILGKDKYSRLTSGSAASAATPPPAG